MLVFLCVSINNVTTQSIGNVVLAVLCDCKDMFADVWLSYYFINVDFFFFCSFLLFTFLRSHSTGKFSLESLVLLT